jgi:hypothetical protein
MQEMQYDMLFKEKQKNITKKKAASISHTKNEGTFI